LDVSAQTEVFNITTANGTNSVDVDGDVAHTITGGTGVDTFIMSREQLAAIGSITGGDGVDVLQLDEATTALVDGDFASRLLRVATLSLTGISTIVLGTNATATGIATVNTGAGATSITSTQAALAVNATNVADETTLTLAGSANYTVTGLQGDLSVNNAHTGNVAVTLASVADATVAFGTNTTGTHSVNADALTNGQILTLTGSDAASVSLVGGDLTASAYVGNLTVTATTGTNVITTAMAMTISPVVLVSIRSPRVPALTSWSSAQPT